MCIIFRYKEFISKNSTLLIALYNEAFDHALIIGFIMNIRSFFGSSSKAAVNNSNISSSKAESEEEIEVFHARHILLVHQHYPKNLPVLCHTQVLENTTRLGKIILGYNMMQMLKVHFAKSAKFLGSQFNKQVAFGQQSHSLTGKMLLPR